MMKKAELFNIRRSSHQKPSAIDQDKYLKVLYNASATKMCQSI